MKKFVCSICGYVYEGDQAPDQCPLCKAPATKFVEQTGEHIYADEHRVGKAPLALIRQFLTACA